MLFYWFKMSYSMQTIANLSGRPGAHSPSCSKVCMNCRKPALLLGGSMSSWRRSVWLVTKKVKKKKKSISQVKYTYIVYCPYKVVHNSCNRESIITAYEICIHVHVSVRKKILTGFQSIFGDRKNKAVLMPLTKILLQPKRIIYYLE